MAEIPWLTRRIRFAVNALGWDVIRYHPAGHPRAKKLDEMRRYRIDTVLDVGANIGQYATYLREHGYRGAIHSFEPLSGAYQRLSTLAGSDPRWTPHHLALGDVPGEVEIHVADSSASSSLLKASEAMSKMHPESQASATETTRVEKLDTLFADLCPQNSRVLLKIDTQGYEDAVLAGAETSLARVDLVYLEMSFAPLYEGQVLFSELFEKLGGYGFRVASLDGGWYDPESGDLMQIDGLFHR